jgi:hypothetical protein
MIRVLVALARSIKNVMGSKRGIVLLILGILFFDYQVDVLSASKIKVSSESKIKDEQRTFLNLCLFISSGFGEKFTGGAITTAFKTALSSKSCYIIVQAHILYSVIHKESKLLEAFDIYEVGKKVKLDGVSEHPQYLYKKDDDAFLFLLVPREYGKKVKLAGFKFDEKYKVLKKVKIEDYKNNLSFYIAELINTLASKKIGKKRFEPIPALKRVFLTNKKSKKEYTWNIFQVGHGRSGKIPVISGLRMRDYSTEITFFNDFLDVNVFVYKSCYAGGINWFVPYQKELLGDLSKLNFTIVAVGTPDVTTIAASKAKIDKFFEALSFIKKNIDVRLKEALAYLRLQYDSGGSLSELVSNFPFVRFAGSQFFSPLIIDEVKATTEYISNFLVKKLQIEGKKSIEIDSYKKKVIFISPSYISFPIHFINIKKENTELILPSFVSVFPGSNIHFFNKLKFDLSKKDLLIDKGWSIVLPCYAVLKKIFYDLNVEIGLKSQKLFVIKSVEFNDFVMKNIVIGFNPVNKSLAGYLETLETLKRPWMIVFNYPFSNDFIWKGGEVRTDAYEARKDIFNFMNNFMKNIKKIGFVERDMEGTVFKLPSQYDYRPMIKYVTKKLNDGSWNKKRNPWDFVWERVENPDVYSDEKLM